MSQQWLYPIFRISGYRVTKCEVEERCLRLYIEPQPHKVCGSHRGSRECIRRGQQIRALKNLLVGGVLSFLFVTIPRVECRACGRVRQSSLGLAEARRSYTRAFARYVLELSRLMTIKDVADSSGRELGCGQGHPEEPPRQALCQTEAEEGEENCRR